METLFLPVYFVDLRWVAFYRCINKKKFLRCFFLLLSPSYVVLYTLTPRLLRGVVGGVTASSSPSGCEGTRARNRERGEVLELHVAAQDFIQKLAACFSSKRLPSYTAYLFLLPVLTATSLGACRQPKARVILPSPSPHSPSPTHVVKAPTLGRDSSASYLFLQRTNDQWTK